MRRPVTAYGWLLVPAVFALAGCNDAGLVNANVNAAFSTNISVGDFHDGLVAGAERVVIRLKRDSLVARRIAVRQGRAMGRPERIEARVTAVASGPAVDTLTFGELGGLKVVINDSTRFRGEADEDHDLDGDMHETAGLTMSDGGDSVTAFTRADFAAVIKAHLAAGRRPNVVVRRPAPAHPQAPDDATFIATSARLDDGDEAAEIAMNVDSANFATNATPPPEGWITVLGLKIEVRASTRITADLPRADGEIEFGGKVTAVDTVAKTVTLADTTTLKFVAGTEFEGHDGDRDDDLFGGRFGSLADVQAALNSGATVTAHGEGILDTGSPRTIIVAEVRFFTAATLQSLMGM